MKSEEDKMEQVGEAKGKKEDKMEKQDKVEQEEK